MAKRKHDEAVEGDDAITTTTTSPSKTDKKRPRTADEGESRKKKKAKKDVKTDEPITEAVDAVDAETTSEAPSAPAKKDKKKSKTPKSDPAPTENPEGAAEGEGETATEDPKKRFIVFVGNLPYSATPSQIETHFASVHPTAVRLLHQKHDPTKSRGIAFVEFARYDHMKTALKLFHHSTFKCPASGSGGSSGRGGGRGGRGPAEEERKINVELTAGGGGNTEYRKERIRAKNEKLNEERARRAREEARVKDKKEREKKAGGAKGGDGGEEGEDEGGEGEYDGKKGRKNKKNDDGMHPSRRRRFRGSFN